MKKIIPLFFLINASLAYAGDTTTVRKYKHEFGVDFTSMIKYYFDFSQNNYGNYSQPAYIFTYRYHLLKNRNIRSGIGGSYSSSDAKSPYQMDSHKYKSTYQQINFRIGYEAYENLSTRFQVFYGVDLRVGYSLRKNDANSWGSGYANGDENQLQEFGIAPVLGLRYRFNKRLSLFTECNLLINYMETYSRRYYTPIDNTYPYLPATPKMKAVNTGVSFSSPLFVVFAIDI